MNLERPFIILYALSFEPVGYQLNGFETALNTMHLVHQVQLMHYLVFNYMTLMEVIQAARYQEQEEEESIEEINESLHNLGVLMRDYLPFRLSLASAELSLDLPAKANVALTHAAQMALGVQGVLDQPVQSIEVVASGYVTREDIQKMLNLKPRRVDQLRKMPWFPKQVERMPGRGNRVFYRRVEIEQVVNGTLYKEWKRGVDADDFDDETPKVQLAERKPPKRPANKVLKQIGG